jgi:hypothetical protein
VSLRDSVPEHLCGWRLVFGDELEHLPRAKREILETFLRELEARPEDTIESIRSEALTVLERMPRDQAVAVREVMRELRERPRGRRSREGTPPEPTIRRCLWCGEVLKPSSARRLYDSPECMRRAINARRYERRKVKRRRARAGGLGE